MLHINVIWMLYIINVTQCCNKCKTMLHIIIIWILHINVTQCYTQDYNVFKWVKNPWVGHKSYTNVTLKLQTCYTIFIEMLNQC